MKRYGILVSAALLLVAAVRAVVAASGRPTDGPAARAYATRF